MSIKVVNKYKEPNHIYCGKSSALNNPFPMYNESQQNKKYDKYEVYFNQKIKIEKKINQCLHNCNLYKKKQRKMM